MFQYRLRKVIVNEMVSRVFWRTQKVTVSIAVAGHYWLTLSQKFTFVSVLCGTSNIGGFN